MAPLPEREKRAQLADAEDPTGGDVRDPAGRQPLRGFIWPWSLGGHNSRCRNHSRARFAGPINDPKAPEEVANAMEIAIELDDRGPGVPIEDRELAAIRRPVVSKAHQHAFVLGRVGLCGMEHELAQRFF